MSDTSNAPSTASGKALVADPENHLWSCKFSESHLHDEPCTCGLAARIRDIEDEAAAKAEARYAEWQQDGSPGPAQLQEADTQLLILREAVEHHTRNHPKECGCGLHAALNSTAEYNKQALARIREEAVKPWREALGRYGSHVGDCPQKYGYACHCGFAQALLASQSKSDTE